MEQVLDVIGATALILLVVIGAVAGLIAGAVAGRRKLLYLAAGIVGAVALPFVLAALGLGVLAAGGLLVIAIVALVGAVLLLAVVRALFGDRRS
ncbi:GlsB/YeaQ/YmgE family stress response membrane protein [Maribius pontilimi]|uniref:GlsB/YeaQ/YmgE family stress response membrane protein n=1 Tax=Palleronia pontilimi TaxID=1964209 RepID=A0A934IFF9_9RHOB|nr:GlsB/YeaQ/YmgE family stress response membrane protein [Palleronia pontilimi]MBJ3762147.1 GlsB/YeaQ/YmgE family stress response membrane protein [Palleronia pontilimi]